MTSLITTSGRQFRDWSADYRFFERERFNPASLFDTIRRGITKQLNPNAPFIVALDDTVSRKKGRKVPGTAWRRDPMSPPFQANLIWGRRFIQVSAILPPDQECAPGRAIPIDFVHAPTPARPKRTASAETWAEYRSSRREHSLAQQGVNRLHMLRSKLSEDGESQRQLWVSADGSYTNRTVLKQLPDNTVFIGRIRRDARLHPLPQRPADGTRGRKRLYGKEIITPDQLRKDPSIPWQTARVYAAGKEHTMRYKTLSPLLWRASGPDLRLRVFVIAPLAYRLSPNSKILYRHPAFLICTDPRIDPEKVIRAYVSRWDIEVNFRDEKQIIGFDQAQVRAPSSASNAPAFAVAAYSLLLLASVRAFGVNGLPSALPPPKWRARESKPRASTSDLINHLRFELWGHAIQNQNFSHFQSPPPPAKTCEIFTPTPASSLFYLQSAP